MGTNGCNANLWRLLTGNLLTHRCVRLAVAVGTARTAGNRLPSRVFLLEFYFVTLVHTNLCKPNRCVTNRVLTGCRWCKGTLGKHWCRPRLPENQFSWCRPRPLERQVERGKGEETPTPPFGMPGTQRHRREGETGQAGPYHCSQSPGLIEEVALSEMCRRQAAES